MAKEDKNPGIEVNMDDGRKLTFGAKQKLMKTTIKTPEGALQVRLDFVNGETRLFTIRADMVADFALHGASQKLGDQISTVEKIEDCVEVIDQLMQRLDAGEWRAERDSSGMAGASVLVKALVEYYAGKADVATVRSYLSGLDNKTKIALRNSAEISPIVKRLEAEAAARAEARGKNAPAIDVASVLAGLSKGPVNSVFPAAEPAAEPTSGEAPAEPAPV